MSIAERLRKLRESQGISQEAVANTLGITRTAYVKYESNAGAPSRENLVRLADFYNISTDYLLGRTNDPVSALHMVDTSRNKRIPVIGRIKAGIPLLAEENFDGEIDVGDISADFALEVIGDSMIYAGVFAGDYVLLKKRETASTGQIVAAVEVNDFAEQSSTLKFYVNDRNAGPVLRAANPEYKDIPFTKYHRIIGVFTGLIRQHEPSIYDVAGIEVAVEQRSKKWADCIEMAMNAGLDADNLIAMIEMLKKVKS